MREIKKIEKGDLITIRKAHETYEINKSTLEKWRSYCIQGDPEFSFFVKIGGKVFIYVPYFLEHINKGTEKWLANG